jgi:hypothetical protein
MRKLLFALGLLLAFPAFADENVIIKTPAGDSAMDETNDAVRVNCVVGCGGSGGTSSTDDGAFTAGSGSGTPAMGFVTTDDVDSGDVGVVGMTDDRAMHTNLRDDQGDSAMDDANNAVRVNIIAGAGSGGTAAADDSAFTIASTQVTVAGCIEATDSMDAGDLGGMKCGADRELDVDVASLPSVTIGTFPDNEPFNVAQINGVTPLMGNGVTGTGSLRVTVASDNTAFTVNAAQSGTWNINNISGTVSLPTGAATSANQSTEITALQLIDNLPLADDAAFTVATTNVVAIGCIEATDTMDAGDVGAVKCGNDRELDVDVASLPSVTIGTFPDNEPFNVAQINGVTPLMGNGVTGTGSLRVTVASDNTAFTVNAAQATAANLNAEVQGDAAADATVSGNPLYMGGRSSEARPTEVTADGEAVGIWSTRSGAQVVAPYGTEVVATGQVSVGTSSTAIVAARVTRRSLMIQNHGTTPAFCMTGTATTGSGFRLPGVDGASITFPTADDVACIVASGSQTVSFVEVYEQ